MSVISLSTHPMKRDLQDPPSSLVGVRAAIDGLFSEKPTVSRSVRTLKSADRRVARLALMGHLQREEPTLNDLDAYVRAFRAVGAEGCTEALALLALDGDGTALRRLTAAALLRHLDVDWVEPTMRAHPHLGEFIADLAVIETLLLVEDIADDLAVAVAELCVESGSEVYRTSFFERVELYRARLGIAPSRAYAALICRSELDDLHPAALAALVDEATPWAEAAVVAGRAVAASKRAFDAALLRLRTRAIAASHPIPPRSYARAVMAPGCDDGSIDGVFEAPDGTAHVASIRIAKNDAPPVRGSVRSWLQPREVARAMRATEGTGQQAMAIQDAARRIATAIRDVTLDPRTESAIALFERAAFADTRPGAK